MTKEQIEAEARIAALEGMVTLLYNVVLTASGLSDEQIAALDQRFLDSAALATISKLDPAMSDHVSDEVRQKTRRLLEGARTLRQ